MTVKSLRALCANCDDTLQFQHEAYRAHVAYRLLIRSLQNLGGSSPSIRVIPEPLYEGLAEVFTRLDGRICDTKEGA